MATKSTKTKTPRLPKKEMLAWIKGRSTWNHDDWLALLADLRAKGFGYYTDAEEGRNELGAFLEANRK